MTIYAEGEPLSSVGPNNLDELGDYVGADVLAQLALAAQRHRVAIHLTVTPYDEDDGEEVTDADDHLQR